MGKTSLARHLVTFFFFSWRVARVVFACVVKVGVAGLVLTYTQQITGLMNWAVRMACEVESRMTCVERNNEYAALPSEQGDLVPPDRVVTTNAVDVARGAAPALVSTPWPATGALAFEAVSMRYRAGLPLVLDACDLAVTGGTKVGICGRSGSGKSSLLVALFRMTPIERSGRILLDGVDIASLSLKQLRRTVGIIPQDPVLFVGTLRDNLDAFNEHSDVELWDALACAALSGPQVRNALATHAHLPASIHAYVCHSLLSPCLSTFSLHISLHLSLSQRASIP